MVRRQFDRMAPVWAAMRRPDSLAPYEQALERVDGPVRRALDVGTGTGAGALEIAKRFQDAEVVGVDVSQAMLEEARRLAPDVQFVQGDASALPFRDAEFDVVAHANMIPFLDETARILRPGGWTVYAFSAGAETPIYVAPERLRRELERRGFTDFAEITAGRGNAVLARRGERV
ncbi:MAG TPA: class I SAM-dependent methyltransferase [Gaiellaceae bacterium]|nr:class I SAM-dependent methyltransferase [Gaiellaceae bacterium]HEX2497132.1 class I SAM-dependent methyltransferase [Gaiellaceae bacterium]